MRVLFATGRLIERAADAEGAAIEDVGVDHGGRDVAVAQKLLDGPDVVAGFEQVRGEAVAEAMAAGGLADSSLSHSGVEGSLQHRLV